MLWKWLLGPWMVAVILLSYLWAQDLQNFPDPPTARIIFWHVPPAMLALVWFAVAAVHSFRFLFGRRRGEMELDEKVRYACEIGLLLTVLTTVTGSVFAYRQWNTPWNWDPKQVSIVVLIVIFLAYFGLRMSVTDPQLRARLSAAYAIFGFASAPFLMYVIPNLPAIQSLHPGGQTLTRGLDPKWKSIYLMATVGFLGITAWIYELRLRLEAVEGVETRAGALAAEPESAEPRITAVRKPVLEE